MEDIVEFNNLHSALATMGTTPAEMHHIWEVLSIILHLGNMQCTEKASESTETDHQHNVQIHSPIMPFDYLSQLLGVDPNLFADRLIHHHVRITRGRRMSAVVKSLSVNDVKNNILGLNKWLYSSLFNWLVKKVNHAHLSVAGRPHHAKVAPGRRHSRAAEAELKHLTNITAIKFIGILDIFGFEILGKNSFEQLCINFANERLQQQFNEHVFVNEQLEYEREGLNWSTITYQDNQHVIDLIAKKPTGLLIILEEYGMLNRAPDDKALLMSFHQAHDQPQNRASVKKSVSGPLSPSAGEAKLVAYAKPRYGGDSFIIKHFAGDVEYSIEGFIIKNNDSLQDDIMEVLMTSTNDFIKNIGEIAVDAEKPGYLPETVGGIQTVKKSTSSVGSTAGGNKKMASSTTVSSMFRVQLDELMATLRSTHPHYIKCIKPNSKKKSHIFEAQLVMQQLRYSGALEVVRIRREGFPQRCNFQEFFSPFQLLSHEKSYRLNSMRRMSRESIQRETLERRITERKSMRQAPELLSEEVNNADDEEYRKDEETLEVLKSSEYEWKGRASDLALTFLPPEEYQVGHAKLFLREGAMRLLQLAMRKFLDGSAAAIQALCRMKSTYKRFEKIRAYIILVQSLIRRYFARKSYHRALQAVRTIQWLAVGKRLRREFILKMKASGILFRRLQSFSIRLRYLSLLRLRESSALRIQCAYRSHKAQVQAQKRRKSIILIQSVARRHKCRQRYLLSLSRIITLQSQIRKRITQTKYHDTINKCILIQSACRKMINYNKFTNVKRSIIKIQTATRKYCATRNYQLTLRACILIQSLCRMMICQQNKQKSYLAVVNIQKIIRKKLAIDHYNRSVRACVLIQSLCRMIHSKEAFRLMKTSAVKLQTFSRKISSQRKYSKIQNCCVLIQSVCRMMIASHKYLLEKSSSIRIQTAIRRKLLQNNYRVTREKCILLQSFFRQIAARKQLALLKEYRRSIESCVVIQSFNRMILQRMRFLKMKQSAISIQTSHRKYSAMTKFRIIRAGFILIQARIRQYLQRVRYLRLVSHCTTLQAFGRQINCRRLFLHQRIRTISLQSAIRRWLLTREYQRIRQNVIKIQTFHRMRHEQRHYASSRLSCIVMQAFGRQIIARRQYLLQRQSCIILQKSIRTYLCQLSYWKVRTSAILIETAFRKYLALAKYQKSRQAVITLQTGIRKYLAKCHYENDIQAIILVQSLYRMMCERRKYRDLVASITRLQSQWRGYNRRCSFLCFKLSAIHVQAVVRCFLGRKKYLLLKERCLRLQQGIRSFLHNCYLKTSLEQLHHTCTVGQGKELESVLNVPSAENQQIVNGKYCADIVPYTTFHLREVLSIRYRTLNFASILHLALSTGNLSIVKSLAPGPTDILAKDKNGNSSAHYVAMYPSVDIIEYLADCLQVRYVYSELLECGVLGEEPAASAPSPVPLRKLFGRRGSFVTIEDDSDDDAPPTAAGNENTSQAFRDRVSSVLTGDCIHQGWLKKRRVGGRWQKRWCVLSQTGLTYFKKKGDPSPRGIIPIEGSTITRQKDPVFIINNERLLTKKHHVGKSPIMEFQADNEKDLQEWLLPLRALAGTGTGERGFRPGNEDDPFTPIHYVNTDLRVAWLNEVNRDGDTPLMMLCRFKNRTADGNPIVPTARILQLAMWLSQNGCSLDAQNKLGQTALHVALRYGNIELANCLIARGADATIRNNDGRSVIDLSPPDFIRDLPGKSIFRDMQQTPILGLNRLRGYSYLTIHFQKHSQTSTSHREDFDSLKMPFLVISVYNQKKKLIEGVQHMPVPVVRRSSYVWWGSVWHMQTPLDNLEEGSYIIIELKNASTSSQILFAPATPTQTTTSTFSSFFSSSSNTPDPASLSGGTSIAWYLLPLNLSNINSGGQSFELFQSPIVYPPASPKEPTPPATAYRSDMSFLEVSCLICKRGKDVDLDEYRTQPEWIHHHRPLPASCTIFQTSEEEGKMSSDYGHTGLISSSLLSISKLLNLRRLHEQTLKALPVFTDEQLSALSIKDLKHNLGVLGVDCSTFFEKSEMREALKKRVAGMQLSDEIVKSLKYAAD